MFLFPFIFIYLFIYFTESSVLENYKNPFALSLEATLADVNFMLKMAAWNSWIWSKAPLTSVTLPKSFLPDA